MIDERHILINGECPISVHREDYGSGASGGVAFLLIMPPAARVNISVTLQTWSLIRDYLALDIITEKMLFCQILIWGSGCKRKYFILPHRLWWKCFIVWKYFGCPWSNVFQAYVVIWIQLHHFESQTSIETSWYFVLDHADEPSVTFFCHS